MCTVFLCVGPGSGSLLKICGGKKNFCDFVFIVLAITLQSSRSQTWFHLLNQLYLAFSKLKCSICMVGMKTCTDTGFFWMRMNTTAIDPSTSSDIQICFILRSNDVSLVNFFTYPSFLGIWGQSACWAMK